MAMTDAAKRKEPEPSVAAGTDRGAAAADKAPAAKAGEPDAKRLKQTPPDAAVVRKQVEYYLSDDNLKTDKFFHEKISSDAERWLDTSLILSCNKMKAMRATKEDIMTALKDSTMEVKDEGAAVRRPGNAALPKLEAKPTHAKKSTIHAHDGGVMAVLTKVPEEQSWMQIKEALKEKLPAKVALWFVSEVAADKAQCFVATSPFDGDVAFFEELKLEIGGATLGSEVCYGELLQQALKLLPKHIRDKRERESRKRQKERNRPIALGTQKFLNTGALRGKVKEILNSRSDGELLKPEGTDYKLIKALLDYHPKGAEKSKGMTGIKVAKSLMGDTRCFWLVKEGGEVEDFSAKKCIDAVELNPPYVKVEPKKKEDAPAAAAAPAEASKEADKKEAAPEPATA